MAAQGQLGVMTCKRLSRIPPSGVECCCLQGRSWGKSSAIPDPLFRRRRAPGTWCHGIRGRVRVARTSWREVARRNATDRLRRLGWRTVSQGWMPRAVDAAVAIVRRGPARRRLRSGKLRPVRGACCRGHPSHRDGGDSFGTVADSPFRRRPSRPRRRAMAQALRPPRRTADEHGSWANRPFH